MKRAISLAWLSALFLLTFVVVNVSVAHVGGDDITYTPKGAEKVVFRHELHVKTKGMKCEDCHYKTFQMIGGGSEYKMDMSVLTKGKFCGTCHNGTKAFDVKDAANCKRCHKG